MNRNEISDDNIVKISPFYGSLEAVYKYIDHSSCLYPSRILTFFAYAVITKETSGNHLKEIELYPNSLRYLSEKKFF